MTLIAGALRAQVTERVSVDSSGVQANYGADAPWLTGSTISLDGRYVVFFSAATSLVQNDLNGTWDVFVRDRLSAVTELVSVDSNGVQANGLSGGYGAAISADGRFVVFESMGNNLVLGDTNGAHDIFLHDRWNGTTVRVSVDSSGQQGNAISTNPSMTPDGRFVVFESAASNLVAGDSNGHFDIFFHDVVTGLTELVSVATSGAFANGDSEHATISADGRFVAFDSLANNISPVDTNNKFDVFVRDRQLGITKRVSRTTAGVQGNGDSWGANISADGRFVAFTSASTNLVPGDTNGCNDLFLNDTATALTTRVSVAADGTQANQWSAGPSFSADGRALAFESAATNLMPMPASAQGPCIFVRDMSSGSLELVSVPTDPSVPSSCTAQNPWISADGRYVVFESSSTNLVPGDTNGWPDVFIHDRLASGFTSVCEPGQDGVSACPCANPPSGSGRGCDNSSSTGGARLGAQGNAYLSIDSLTLVTRFETPHATSVVLGGDALLAGGALFGQGVRCVGGNFARLYVKQATNGGIRAPEISSGDAPISARSAQLGLPVQAGVPCYYFVYYRDPLVLGGCQVASTFNATQAGAVAWWP